MSVAQHTDNDQQNVSLLTFVCSSHAIVYTTNHSKVVKGNFVQHYNEGIYLCELCILTVTGTVVKPSRTVSFIAWNVVHHRSKYGSKALLRNLI